MATELTEVQLQVLSAVRDEGVPTSDAEVVRRTGLTEEAVREAVLALSDDYLLVKSASEERGIEILDFKGDASVARPPTRDWQE